VKYDATRKFGFIRRDDREPDVFVHVTGFISSAVPKEGDRVTFDLVIDENSGKPRAAAVRIV
jgi:cold shock CspA family protein